MIIKSEAAMLDFGADLAHKLQLERGGEADGSGRRGAQSSGDRVAMTATLLELVGDVGTGKTTFVRGLARGLGVQEPITSPSFTISKTYALASGGRLIHYDFYRLQDPGLMADDLAENLADPTNFVVIEWGGSVRNLLPPQHLKITFAYRDDGAREVSL